jgi:hypothetical protein
LREATGLAPDRRSALLTRISVGEAQLPVADNLVREITGIRRNARTWASALRDAPDRRPALRSISHLPSSIFH